MSRSNRGFEPSIGSEARRRSANLVVGSILALAACSRFAGIESKRSQAGASASVPAVASSAPVALPPLDVDQLMARATPDEQGLRRIGEALLRPDVDVVAVTQALQPRPDDYRQVFDESVVNKAQARYLEFWENGLPIRPWPEHKSVSVVSATAEELQAGGAAAGAFPQAYRELAGKLKGELRVFALRFESSKGARPLTYDGFVHVGGRWAYFPKPFRVVR